MIWLLDIFFYVFLAAVFIPILAMMMFMVRQARLGREVKHIARLMGVHWWDAAAPLTLGTGIFVLTSLLGDIPTEGEPGYLTFGFEAAVLFVGVIGAMMTLGNFDEYRQLMGGTASIGTLGEGPTVVSGTASPREEVLTAPLSGEPTLYYSLRVTDRRRIGHRTFTVELHYTQDSRPFVVDDRTGTAIVDSEDAEIRLWDDDQRLADTVVSSDVADDTRQDTLKRIRKAIGLEPGEGQTFKEMRLPPESEITVLGTVERDPEVRYPVVHDGDRRLAIFEGSFDDVRSLLRKRIRGGAGLGVLGLLLGAVGMFLTAGVL